MAAGSLRFYCYHAAAAVDQLSRASSSVILKSPFALNRGYGSTVSACVKQLRSTDLVALEYSELNLSEKSSGELGCIRIRQHVNPLSSSFSVPAETPDWKEVYRDPTRPLMVDIGSGSGRFLIWLAKRNPDSGNYLGIEIRQKLVKRADFWIKEMALGNIHFLFANATVSFRQLILSYPGPLMLVSILVSAFMALDCSVAIEA
uniref:tRNA (guanine(46)-N(7))-methyltransferase n=1 Tax=Rhizophora mucronata TaxID=61149 RepID=A0A2P2KCN9_RHIMU